MTSDIVRSTDGAELDRIRLVGLSATGYHGVFPEERRDGQVFRADVVLHVDTRPAARSDDLADTVDYAALADGVVSVLEGQAVDLIETLAQRIADVALSLPGVEAVDVVVHKPQAPIQVPFDDVRLEIRRRRARPEDRVGPARSDGPPPAGEAGADASDPLERRPGAEVGVVLALGGNVGDVAATLREAIEDLDDAAGLTIDAVSPFARTVAVGGPVQDDYLNAVVTGRTSLSPRELLALTSSVEDAHGRVRVERWGARTLDIDIISVEGVLSADPVLELPHPRARERAFVLLPWARVDPEAVLPGPGGGAVSELAALAPDRDGVRWLAEPARPADGPSSGGAG